MEHNPAQEHAPKTERIAPTIQYQVYATLVNWNRHKIVGSPTSIPARAPRALAPRSNVPSRKRPRRLPKGRDATINPVSSSGPHFTKPKPISTRPHRRVKPRERRRKRA